MLQEPNFLLNQEIGTDCLGLVPNSSAVVILNVHFVAGSLLNQHSQYLTFPPTVAPLPLGTRTHWLSSTSFIQIPAPPGEGRGGKGGGRKEGREEGRGEEREGVEGGWKREEGREEEKEEGLEANLVQTELKIDHACVIFILEILYIKGD